MYQIHVSLAALLFATFFIGCASKPSALDAYMSQSASEIGFVDSDASDLVPNPASNAGVNSSDFVRTRYSGPMKQHSQEFELIQKQLRSGQEFERIAACKQLGIIAARNDGELSAIETLAKVMKSDPSMEVRVAATDAMGSLSNASETGQLSGLIPSEKLPEAPTERVSLLKRLWR